MPSPRPVPVKEIQLVDRVQEMQVLKQAAAKAFHGEGGVIFLHGEAGIGKTKLTRELEVYACSRGMQVLSGRCPGLLRMDGVPPYVLWIEVIRDYFRICTPEQLYRVIGFYPSEVCRLVPELSQKLRVVPKPLPISPEHERNRLFEGVSQFITNISRENPLLIILDDLQWTDQSSLLLLHYLARGISKESLLILGAYRDTDVDERHALSPVLTELNRERLFQSIPLKRLSSDNVMEMIKRILEQEDVPRGFCELVYHKTRGNPFFVEEVIRSLKEEEVIHRKRKKWQIKEASGISLPETVRDVIKARIDGLGEESQHVLTMASFVGKDFTFDVLREVTKVEEDKLLGIVDRLLKTGLFKHRVIHGEDVFSFGDIIVRDVVYEEVGFLSRKKLHGAVGYALEKAYDEKIDEHFGELALHFLESGDRDRALDYFLKAGDRATQVYANNEVVFYFQSALDLLKEEENAFQEKGRILERLGDIKRLVGEYESCMKYWNDALLLWKRLDEKEKIARLHRKMANTLWLKIGNTEKAKEHHKKALKFLETQTENIELASLYQDMASCLSMIGELKEALTYAEKALELANKMNAHEVIASSYASMGDILGWLGDRKKGLRCLKKALRIAIDNDFAETALWALNDIAGAVPAEENEKRMEYLNRGYDLAKKVGDTFWISWIGSNLANSVYIGMGQMNKAILLAEESVALDIKGGNLSHLSVSLDILGFAYQILGEWEKSEQHYKEALSVSKELDEFQQIAYSYGFLGLFHHDKGEYNKAKEYYEKMNEVFENAGAKSQQMSTIHWVIRTYIELGESEKAESLIDTLSKFAVKAKNKVFLARLDVLKAMLFRTQKKWKESIEHFENGLRQHEALHAKRWNVYWFAKMILCEYARVYLERDQKGDREKARSLLNQALELFRKMGAQKDIEKIKSRLAHIETGRQMLKPEPAAEVIPSARVTTGYRDLDDLLSGGIPRNYAIILTSLSCDERGLLIRRFLEAGARKDEVTFYVTIDPGEVKSLAEEFRSNFYLFICNPQADKIVKDMPNVFKLKGVENLTDINIALTSAFRKLDKSLKESRRICIEIISDILLQHHTVQTRRWLNALIPELKSKAFTTLAVLDPEIHSHQEVRAIVGVFEGEINIYEKDTEKGAEKSLKIKKMYNQKYSKSELLLQEEILQKRE